MRAVFQSLVAGSFCWFLASSLWVYPHSLSYFNESIGGPLNGPEHLLGSSADWGQDLFYFKSLSRSSTDPLSSVILSEHGPSLINCVLGRTVYSIAPDALPDNAFPRRVGPTLVAVSVTIAKFQNRTAYLALRDKVSFDTSVVRDSELANRIGYSMNVYSLKNK